MANITRGTVLVNTYEIIDVIGSGGGGVTYKARHLRLNTDVVVKKIKEDIVDKVNIRAEADILKRLKHAYLPMVYDFIEAEDGVYTVIDYIPGDNLEDAVKKHGPYDQNTVLKWANQLGEALAYLHSQKPAIIHSDIKPANIMLTKDGNICLIDFNISLALGESMESAVGVSPGFSPPEQFKNINSYVNMVMRHTGSCSIYNSLKNANASNRTAKQNTAYEATEILDRNTVGARGEQKNTLLLTPMQTEYVSQMGRGIDAKSDVYSLGMTLVYLLTGVRSSLDFDQRVTIDDTRTILLEGFGAIIKKMINYNPDNRYRDGVEFLNALHNIHKYDSRYKVVHRVQNIMQIISLCVFTMGVIMIAWGVLAQNNQHNGEYNRYLSEAERKIDIGEYTEAEKLIDKAIEVDSNRGEAYREIVYLLYCSGNYEEAIEKGVEYINSPTLKSLLKETAESRFNSNEQSVGDTYYLIGNSYFELKDYSKAAEYLKIAIDFNTKNGLYYRDYAIVLATMGDDDLAMEQLEIAEELGIANDSIYLVKGQISYSKGDYLSAVDYFKECLLHAESEQLLKRALFLCSEAYNALGAEYADENIAMLRSYENSFGNMGSLMVKEYLAIAYMVKAEEDPSYNAMALEQFEQMLSSGYSSFQTEENIAIIYSNMGEWDKATDVLLDLVDKYPSNYEAYKDLAYVEIYAQADKDNSKRDYHKFKYYYDMAKSLCGQIDDEMEMLERVEKDLLNGGWELN